MRLIPVITVHHKLSVLFSINSFCLFQATASEDEMEEIIDYIPEHLFGKVIGTGGSGQTRIYNATGARLNVTKDNVLKLKGSAQQRELAHPLLRRILVSSVNSRKT